MSTAYAMLNDGLRLMGMVPTDALRAQHYIPFLFGVNNAQVDIYTNRLKLVKWSTAVTLTADKTFDTNAAPLTTATEYCAEVLKVSLQADYSSGSSWVQSDALIFEMLDDNTFVVPGATAAGTVYVQYRPLPIDLVVPNPPAESGSTSPAAILVPHQRALTLKGVVQVYFSLGQQATAVGFEQLYQQELDKIVPVKRQEQITSVYST
jgi:hypothetical protein